jgi:hypothetical protein
MDKRFLEDCLAKGMSLETIGEQVGKHPSTVGYWLKKHGLTAANPRGSRRRRGVSAKTATFDCRRHGVADFILEGRGYYRCKQCRAAAVAKRRRTVKLKLVEEAGGACALCGYERWIGALHFHHLDPGCKEFHIGQRGYSRSLARSRAEARKCVLLCANCHAEVEGRFATLPVDSHPLSDELSGGSAA